MAHRASSVQPLSTKPAAVFRAICGEPVANSRHGRDHQRQQQAQRHDAEQLIGVAPADPVDQDLRRRQQHQDAGAGRGIDDRHRGRQPRAEPAAEQDRVRYVADKGDAETDAEADAELELPQLLRMRRDQERAAEQQQSERIDHARAGAVEQAADQRRGQSARQPGQRIDRDHLGAVPAEVSEIGFRNTVKLSPRPRPSTDSAKHRASTLSATRAGLSGRVGASSRGVFWSMGAGSAFPLRLASV